MTDFNEQPIPNGQPPADFGAPAPQPGSQFPPPPAEPTPPAPQPAAQPFGQPLLPEPTTLPGGDSYHPSPAVMLAPGHGNKPVRPHTGPLLATIAISCIAVLLAGILVALELRPVKTVPLEQEPATITPAAQPETVAPAPAQPEADDEVRSFEKAQAEPTIDKAKAAFKAHSPGIYGMVQDLDDPKVRPTNQGLSFTWTYMDSTSSSAVQVHTYTVELDDKGKAVDFFGE